METMFLYQSVISWIYERGLGQSEPQTPGKREKQATHESMSPPSPCCGFRHFRIPRGIHRCRLGIYGSVMRWHWSTTVGTTLSLCTTSFPQTPRLEKRLINSEPLPCPADTGGDIPGHLVGCPTRRNQPTKPNLLPCSLKVRGTTYDTSFVPTDSSMGSCWM
jgi:hypothetical protein